MMTTPVALQMTPPPIARMDDSRLGDVACRICWFCIGSAIFATGAYLCAEGWMNYYPWIHSPIIPGAFLIFVSGPCLWHGWASAYGCSEER